MNSDIKNKVVDWYSRDNVLNDNALTYPKNPNYVDCVLLKEKYIKNKNVLNLGCCYPSDEIQFSHLANKWTAIDRKSVV